MKIYITAVFAVLFVMCAVFAQQTGNAAWVAASLGWLLSSLLMWFSE